MITQLSVSKNMSHQHGALICDFQQAISFGMNLSHSAADHDNARLDGTLFLSPCPMSDHWTLQSAKSDKIFHPCIKAVEFEDNKDNKVYHNIGLTGQANIFPTTPNGRDPQ